MKIPHQLYQFEDVSTFIIVAGKQDAHLYQAHQGEIKLLDVLKISKAHYSDNEGLSKARSSNGGGIRAATVEKSRDQEVISEFIKELKVHMEKVRADMYAEVFVMAPAKTKNEIVNNLPQPFRKKLKNVITGNYGQARPLDIVKKIRATVHTETHARTFEEQQILNNAQQASHVTRTRSD